MPVLDTDYQLTDIWDDDAGQEYLNVYFFRRAGGAGLADNLIDAFQANAIPDIAAILHTSMDHVRTDAFNLVDTGDFDSQIFVSSGTNAGEVLPHFVAASLRILRADRNFRSGAKRYGRFSEGNLISNDYDAAYRAKLVTLSLTLTTQWTQAGTTWDLVLAKRILVAGKYVLDDFSIPAGAIVTGPTTQNSRKNF